MTRAKEDLPGGRRGPRKVLASRDQSQNWIQLVGHLQAAGDVISFIGEEHSKRYLALARRACNCEWATQRLPPERPLRAP